MHHMLNRFLTTLNFKHKALLFTLALLLPFCAVLILSLGILWQRTSSALEQRMAEAEKLVLRSVAHFQASAAIYSKIISENYLIRQAAHLNDVGSIKKNTQHLFDDLKTNHIIVYDENGVPLHQLTRHNPEQGEKRQALIGKALSGQVIVRTGNNSNQVLIESFRPIYHTNIDHLLVGCVCVGFHFNNDFARELKQICGIDNILVHNERIIASSLDSHAVQTIGPLSTNHDQSRTRLGIGGKQFDASAVMLEGEGLEAFRLYAAQDYSEIKGTLRQTSLIIFFAFMVVSIMGAALALGIAKRMIQSAKTIVDHARDLSEKKFDRMIDVESQDEFAEVADAFNLMSQRLKESFIKIENQAADLSGTKTYLDNVIDSIPSLLIGVDRNGRIVILNHMARAYFDHVSVEEGMTSFESLLEGYGVPALNQIRSAIKSHQHTRIENLNIEIDQKQIFHNLTVFPVITPGQGDSMIRIDDVTEQFYLEAKLRQSQKMEAIGRLAGGIAHDFNNILSGIFGYAQLGAKHIEQPGRLKNHLLQITKGAQRATELVQQILTFSRRTEYQKHHLRIYLEIKETLKLLRSTIPTTIDIKTRLNSRSMVLADPTKIHQVVMNLCTNAYHAMRDTGGLLTVSLSEVEVTESRPVFKQQIPKGNYLLLTISDTGAGMDAKTLENAFEPYYTTRDSGQGTGLGLSIVQAIIDEHDGFLEVESEPGKGTIFSIYFPAAPEVQGRPAEEADEEPVYHGRGTIMVVDDESSIREFLKELLEENGYTVAVFSNGGDAFGAFKDAPDTFDLIISDMTMPEIPGDELAQKVLALRPQMPIFLCTGFSERISETRAQDIGIRQYFQKPLDNQVLLASVYETLSPNWTRRDVTPR